MNKGHFCNCGKGEGAFEMVLTSVILGMGAVSLIALIGFGIVSLAS